MRSLLSLRRVAASAVLVVAAVIATATPAAATLNYLPVPGRSTVYSNNNGVNYVFKDGTCEYLLRYTIASNGVSVRASVWGSLTAGTKCDVFAQVEFYNWDTNTFSIVDMGSFFGVSKGNAQILGSWDLGPVGNIQNRRGLTFMWAEATVGDYVGTVSQSGKTALYDVRMCTPSPYALWDCGYYLA